jgi:uncharacterized protein YkwD
VNSLKIGRKIKFLIFPLFFIIISCSQDESDILVEEESSDNVTESSITKEILKLVNEHRQSIGKSSLVRNSVADNLAEDHTYYMISENKISHDNFNARFQELQQKVNAKSAGENVASGYPTAVSVMTGWLNSSGHKANIEGNFMHIGIAAIKDSQGRYYYTQLFYR